MSQHELDELIAASEEVGRTNEQLRFLKNCWWPFYLAPLACGWACGLGIGPWLLLTLGPWMFVGVVVAVFAVSWRLGRWRMRAWRGR